MDPGCPNLVPSSREPLISPLAIFARPKSKDVGCGFLALHARAQISDQAGEPITVEEVRS